MQMVQVMWIHKVNGIRGKELHRTPATLITADEDWATIEFAEEHSGELTRRAVPTEDLRLAK